MILERILHRLIVFVRERCGHRGKISKTNSEAFKTKQLLYGK